MDINVSNHEFLQTVFGADAQWAHVTSFLDDPADIPADRRGICWAGGYYQNTYLQPHSNQYYCISTFYADKQTGRAVRRKADFRATHVIVADDVREKLDVAAVERLPAPTFKLRTSPGSEQWGWVLDRVCTDRIMVENLLDGLVERGLAPDGKDPGMKGVTRYVRLPEGVNTKASRVKANGGTPPRCKMLEWNPTVRVSIEQLARPFNVDLHAERRDTRVDGAAELPDHPLLNTFAIHVKETRSAGRFDITCPWVNDHTGRGDDGSAIFTNADGSLGFKCHHGSCSHRTGRDLIDYVESTAPGFKQRLSGWQIRHQLSGLGVSVAPEIDFMGTDTQLVLTPIGRMFPDVSRNNRPKNTIRNFESILNHYNIIVRYNVISKRTEVIYPGKNTSLDNENSVTDAYIISLAALNGFPLTKISEYLQYVADSNQFNPVMEFINSHPWDGRSRIEELLNTIKIRADFNPELRRFLVVKWLISAVAAAAMPSGFHGRGVLVLQGPQGIGKTSWFKKLVGEDLTQYFKDGAILDPREKDSIIGVTRMWIVELGELDATFRKADIARLKSFITQDMDRLRKPFGKAEESYQRRTVLCGSVNDEQFLVDPTGNSRFWVIPLETIDYQHAIDMQQLWSEIYSLFQEKPCWWLTPDEEKMLSESNKEHEQIDPIHEQIAARYAATNLSKQMERLTATKVLEKLGHKLPTTGECRRAGEALRRLGFDVKKSNGQKLFTVPYIVG